MLTQQQKDLIFGTLLGDGNLQTSNGVTWKYRAVQQAEHKDYLFHKYEVLKPLCKTEPRYQEDVDKRTNKTTKRYYFNTLVSPSLNFFANMFYKRDPQDKSRWVKIVPIKVEKFLTPAAIAYLYMDDGALKWLGNSNAMRICTENFSPEEVQRLMQALKNRYEIVTKTEKKTLKNGEIRYRIYIPENSSAAFRELIKPYLVDPMKYKVSDGNKGHL